MARAYAEMFSPRPFDLTTFPNDAGYDELIIARSIPVHSVCEHHLLPFVGVAHVGYLPGERILGLSKLARVVELFARRPQVQERLTQQIADWLQDHVAPRGVGVVVEAEHLCMTVRGVGASGRHDGHVRTARPAPQRRRLTSRVLHPDRRERGAPWLTIARRSVRHRRRRPGGRPRSGDPARGGVRREDNAARRRSRMLRTNALPCPRTISRATLTGTASSCTRVLGTPNTPWICLWAAAVTSLDPATRTVTTATGAQLHYDKLLLATGSKPRRLELPGADLDGVYYLRNVEDSERIKIEFAQRNGCDHRRRLDRIGNRRRSPRSGTGRHAPRIRRHAAAACARPRGCAHLCRAAPRPWCGPALPNHAPN